MPVPPAKPPRANSVRPSFDGDEREFLLRVLQQQTDELGGKIDGVLSETRAAQVENERRFLQLERAQVESALTRSSVDSLARDVRTLLESDGQQNRSLVALTAALKPAVEATAAIEGSASGAKAGKLSGRLWGLVGSALALVIAGAVQQCQVQIERGAFTPAPASSK